MESKSEENIESFDANKVLPTNVLLKSVDNHLFRIGLSFNHYTNDESRKKRHFLNNPILINSVLFIQLIKCIINLNILDPMLVIWTGDFARALGFRVHHNIVNLLLIAMTMSSSLIWYYNYSNGIEPQHLRLFQVMSGHIPPKHLGITEEKQILPLIKRTKLLIIATNFNSFFCVTFAIVLILATMTKATLLEYLFFGIPNIVHYSLFCYYIFNFSLIQGFYCQITCRYIRNKIKRLNESLLRNETPIHSTLESMDSLYKEIDGYNCIFWSKYFINFWVFFGSITVFLLYCAVFTPMLLVFKLMYFYGAIVFGNILPLRYTKRFIS